MVIKDNNEKMEEKPQKAGDEETKEGKEAEKGPKDPDEEHKTKEALIKGFGVEMECDEVRHNIIGGKPTDFILKIKNKGKKNDTFHITINTINPLRSEESPEWFIKLFVDRREMFDKEMQDVLETDFDVDGGGTINLRIQITAPHSVDYGERVDMVVTSTSKGDPAQSESITFAILVRQSIQAIKTSIGHERAVADTLYNRALRKETGIYSILAPEKLRGYVLVETINPDGLSKVVKGIKRSRGVVEGDIPFNEIDHFLTPKPLVAGIVVGDIVELIAGPFKGEKARVQQIDESKEEITVELFEAVVPIPITIRGDHVRVLETEGR
ncbi:MAG: transcription elongation factor Spt5 [Methanomassiliicoccales archaeon]|nr:MAG: transcription elongation factor Spt5 [Methanomassiliicoccales archaeon]